MRPWRRWCAVLALLCLLGCSLPLPGPAEPPSAQPVAPAAAPAHTATPACVPTALGLTTVPMHGLRSSPPASASRTPTPFPTPRRAASPGPAPKDLPAVLTAVPTILSEHGGDVAALVARLQAWGALEPAANPWRQADLDGDGRAELLLLAGEPRSVDKAHWLTPGTRALLVLVGSGNVYALGDSRPYKSAFRLDVPLVADLNADARPEIVATYQDCSANVCFLFVEVLVWEAGRLQSRLERPLTMPFAALEVEDRDCDGRFELSLRGGAYDTAGTGPIQPRREVYAWNGQTYALAQTIFDPSPVRIHVFLDGDRALRRGDLKAALALYERVATDRALAETHRGKDVEERRTLEAFAYYRMLTVQAALGDRPAAARSLEALRTRYGEHPCHPLAQAFWEAWQANGDLAAGCAAATAYATAHPEVLAAFGDYGQANPRLKVEDLCLLGR